jgi:hypothetical protein
MVKTVAHPAPRLVLRFTKTLTNEIDAFVRQARRKPQRYLWYRADLQRRMASEGAIFMSRF